MDSIEIKAIIKQGENSQVEFKECQDRISHSVYETVCSFLNYKGETPSLYSTYDSPVIQTEEVQDQDDGREEDAGALAPFPDRDKQEDRGDSARTTRQSRNQQGHPSRRGISLHQRTTSRL